MMLWGAWGDDFGETYVRRMFNMISRNVSVPFEFWCITDRNIEGINCFELPNDIASWHGRLPKFYMHSYDMPFDKGDRIIFFDLDMIITANIDNMILYDGGFCGVKAHSNKVHHVDGSLLSFVYGNTEFLWEFVSENLEICSNYYRGNERWILRDLLDSYDYWQDIFPNEFVSYKWHCKNKQLPSEAKIIQFHGKPKPHEIKGVTWIKDYWKNLS